MTTVFLSYRRADEPFAVDQLERFLSQELGEAEVFRDVSDIAGGTDFRRQMTIELERSSVVVVVVGSSWQPGRLFDRDDHVLFEIETALQLGKRVLPVLVGGASWPAAADLPPQLRTLAGLNHLPLRGGSDLEHDSNAILDAILSVRPLVLSARVQPRLLFIGKCTLRLDGIDVAVASMRSGITFGPVPVRPGHHSIEAITSLGTVANPGRCEFVIRQPGAWHVAIELVKGKFIFTLDRTDEAQPLVARAR